MTDFSIVLVGAGNMGGAMMAGWLENGISPGQICVLDPNPHRDILEMIDQNGIRHETDSAALGTADVILVAVKPQVMGDVLDTISHLVSANNVVISVAAGKTLSFMEAHLGAGAMVRAMPNTPALVRRGISVACANGQVRPEQKKRTSELLGATGSVEWIEDETLMDAVTAVSGSGPAYAFHLVEALADAAVDAGLPDVLARKLALETIAGAGEMMMQSDFPPSRLRENVTSPGGTTQAALEVLMGPGGFDDLLGKAVKAAAKRSRELS